MYIIFLQGVNFIDMPPTSFYHFSREKPEWKGWCLGESREQQVRADTFFVLTFTWDAIIITPTTAPLIATSYFISLHKNNSKVKFSFLFNREKIPQILFNTTIIMKEKLLQSDLKIQYSLHLHVIS